MVLFHYLIRRRRRRLAATVSDESANTDQPLTLTLTHYSCAFAFTSHSLT